MRAKWISANIQKLAQDPSQSIRYMLNIYNPTVRRKLEAFNSDQINLLWQIGVSLPAQKTIAFVDQNPQFTVFFNIWNRFWYNNRFLPSIPRISKKTAYEFSTEVFRWAKRT